MKIKVERTGEKDNYVYSVYYGMISFLYYIIDISLHGFRYPHSLNPFKTTWYNDDSMKNLSAEEFGIFIINHLGNSSELVLPCNAAHQFYYNTTGEQQYHKLFKFFKWTFYVIIPVDK